MINDYTLSPNDYEETAANADIQRFKRFPSLTVAIVAYYVILILSNVSNVTWETFKTASE